MRRRRRLCCQMAVPPAAAMAVSRPTALPMALPTVTTGRTVQSTVTVTEVPPPMARYCPTAATRRPTTTCEAISRQRSRLRSDNPAAATRPNNSEYDRQAQTNLLSIKNTLTHTHIHKHPDAIKHAGPFSTPLLPSAPLDNSNENPNGNQNFLSLCPRIHKEKRNGFYCYY